LPLIRILVVDDHENWRHQVHSLLQAWPAWHVIAEASDGSEAVQKAADLKPDLIVLDLGLPKLNGIEAARQIRQLSPNSKIIFLSQNSDLDVVRAALDTGAFGYVRKTGARRELLPAVDAALRGKQFVSRSLKDYQFTDTSVQKSANSHEVQFYSDDALLLDTFARFIAVALKSGRAAIVAVTESFGDGLVSRLKEHGLDVDAAKEPAAWKSAPWGL
jgi:DNA-binding NarL/FixJ family response regulator